MPTTGEVPTIMRALEHEVVDAVYAAIEPLLPEPPVHPLGCHRPRVPDRLVFWGILIRRSVNHEGRNGNYRSECAEPQPGPVDSQPTQDAAKFPPVGPWAWV